MVDVFKSLPKLWRTAALLLPVLLIVFFVAYQIESALPTRAPDLQSTDTPATHLTSQEIGSYDVLGRVISKAEAEQLLQTETGKVTLSPAQGAVKITQELIDLGRKAFYTETFGNEYFFTDVVAC
jgi:hypothetical protein